MFVKHDFNIIVHFGHVHLRNGLLIEQGSGKTLVEQRLVSIVSPVHLDCLFLDCGREPT